MTKRVKNDSDPMADSLTVRWWEDMTTSFFSMFTEVRIVLWGTGVKSCGGGSGEEKLGELSCSFGAVRRNRFPIMLCDPAVGGTVVG